MWGTNPRPHDQKSSALLTEQNRTGSVYSMCFLLIPIVLQSAGRRKLQMKTSVHLCNYPLIFRTTLFDCIVKHVETLHQVLGLGGLFLVTDAII
jgi:hypothetical protein